MRRGPLVEIALAVCVAACAPKQAPYDARGAAEDDAPYPCYFYEDLFRNEALNAALETLFNLPPRDADGKVSCAWFEGLKQSQHVELYAVIDQMYVGGAQLPASPNLAYDWSWKIAQLDQKDTAYWRAVTLLDPDKRHIIASDPEFRKSALPDIDLNADLICSGTLEMVTAAIHGHEAALRWNYEDELANARDWLFPLDEDILSPDPRDRHNIMQVFSPNLIAYGSIQAVEGILYSMYLEGFDVPEEAQARLDAIVRGDYANEVSAGYVLDKPRRFRRYMSTILERYCP